MNIQTVSSLLMEAGSLMLIGMLFVFTFLGLLIVGVRLITICCNAFPSAEVENTIPAPRASASPNVDNKVVAAITAAIHTHRQNNKNN